jgi:uncharacterized protein (TIGR04255 family)
VALQEVVFEIRFPPIEDYAIFAGAMAVSHKEHFPVSQKLEPPGLPEFVSIAGLVRHRFSGQDQSKLFQIGSDVISVNYLQYTNFDTFIQVIKEILSSAQNNGAKISYASKIGLRYINRFDNIADPFEFLNLSSPFTNNNFDITKLIQVRKVDQVETGLFLDINVQFNSNDNDKDLILDLNSFYQIEGNPEEPDQQWSIEKLIDWISKAHDLIKENFCNLVPKLEEGVEK